MNHVMTAGGAYNARLAQLVERTAFNRVVAGSTPTVGNLFSLGCVVFLINSLELV